MPILGIDESKCTQCEQCIQECPSSLFTKDDNGQIIYADSLHECILCGHCVAICPSDAILREKMDDVDELSGVKNSADLVSFDNLFQLIRFKRSVRRFTKEPISQEIVDKILNTMRYAPTGGNSRNLNFLVLSDPEKIHSWGEAIGDRIISAPGFGMVYGKKIQQRRELGREPIFHDAPIVIVAFSSETSDMELTNATIAFTYGMLAAETLGISSCWCGFGQIAMNADKDLMKNMGARGKVMGVVLFGHPANHFYRLPSRPPLKVKTPK
jgi:nitroreductase/NAD-dependent dihydropyrimidine dehydrogenase PreA subunit